MARLQLLAELVRKDRRRVRELHAARVECAQWQMTVRERVADHSPTRLRTVGVAGVASPSLLAHNLRGHRCRRNRAGNSSVSHDGTALIVAGPAGVGNRRASKRTQGRSQEERSADFSSSRWDGSGRCARESQLDTLRDIATAFRPECGARRSAMARFTSVRGLALWNGIRSSRILLKESARED